MSAESVAEHLKRQAALRALDHVTDGMLLGLGSGTTAEIFLEELGRRVADGLRIVGIPTSLQVARLAARHRIPLTDLDDGATIDLTVDGADEIDPRTLNLVKGHGGALVREKLVAVASQQELIIADASKLVQRLGEHGPVPVAVVQFGWQHTARAIERLGARPERRLGDDGRPFVSDDGLYILDCHVAPIDAPQALARALKEVVGVVEHGLFLGLAQKAIVAAEDGVQELDRPTPT
ncbi:MAG TPA: ribose-5-phosphate isomerase RpiA [Chloroflexota bacterium]